MNSFAVLFGHGAAVLQHAGFFVAEVRGDVGLQKAHELLELRRLDRALREQILKLVGEAEEEAMLVVDFAVSSPVFVFPIDRHVACQVDV